MVKKPYQLHLPWAKDSTANRRAGSCRTKESVHEALKRALDGCEIPREDVAKELSRLVGENITINTLNNWCAEGKTNRRFPLECVKALALITGDISIISAALEPEFSIIDDVGRAHLEYGRMLMEDRDRTMRKRQLREAVERNGK